MNLARLCLVLLSALAAAGSLAADAGIATVVEGDARLLRVGTWYKLAPGARVEAGDIIASAAKSTVQVEFPAGNTLNLAGPAELLAAMPVAGDKSAGPREFALAHGWMKFVAKSHAPSERVRTSLATLDLTEAIVVVHAEPEAIEMFVESGLAAIAATDAGREGAAQEANASEYWARSVHQPWRTEHRAPPAFVAAMPRDMADPLPSLADRYPQGPAALVPLREIAFAEAEPWLTGPYRRAFVKRFEPRLKDREFRLAVESHIALFPEWDRLLHPEKYAPKASAPPR